METQTERLVEVDEGSGAEVPAEPVVAAPTESEPSVPKGYEGVPPELWPDKDGNPPPLTPELMKKLRGKYFTIRHIKVTCGHRLDQINQPKNNCHECWAAFFGTHPQLVEVAHQMYQTRGRRPVVALRGEKFVKFFEKFMALMYQEMQRRQKEEESKRGTENSEHPDGARTCSDIATARGDSESSEATAPREVGQSGSN